MFLHKKITYYRKILIYFFFILLHLFLFNINTAEWGDSYRILRASEYIRDFSYPQDEKRPPLFSLILAFRPASVDPVFWGRLIMFVISFVSLIYFDKLLSFFFKNKKLIDMGLFLFILNPVYLYWSIRIMADVPFTLFVLLAFYYFYKWKDNLNLKHTFVLGLISALAICTRFEGYILLGALTVGIILKDYTLNFKKLKFKDILNVIKNKHRSALLYIFSVFIFLLPYLLFRNPLSSTYLEEPAGRTYNIKTLWIYAVSLFYVLGYIPLLFFISKEFKKIKLFLFDNIALFSFLMVELILCLLWPAAIPRLFTPIIPILIILFVLSFKGYLKEEKRSLNVLNILFLSGIFSFYFFSQYILRLQFLIPSMKILLISAFLQGFSIIFLLIKKHKISFFFVFISILIWSLSTVWIHKDIFISVKNAAKYASQNLRGVVAYNDVSSVSDWYLNYADSQDKVSGYYYGADEGKYLTKEALNEQGLDYVLITNEHNTGLEIDFEKRHYLEVIKEFRYNVNGTKFFAVIAKFDKDK